MAGQATQATMKLRRQCAAIPITVDALGELNVLLVRLQGANRWIVPKSWASTTSTLADAAAREAFEMAGVVGPIVGDTPVARYRRLRRLAAMRPVSCEVSVFLLRVERHLDTWPGHGQWQTKWFTSGEAATFIDDAELARLLRGLPSLLDWLSREHSYRRRVSRLPKVPS